MSSTLQPSDMTGAAFHETRRYPGKLDRRTDKIYLVTGSSSSQEVFLGRAIEESSAGHVLLEGKCLTMPERGWMTVRPFSTRLKLQTESPSASLHLLSDPGSQLEALGLLGATYTRVGRTVVPAIYAWVETALAAPSNPESAPAPAGDAVTGSGAPSPLEPSRVFHEVFVQTCDEFRRVLFQNPSIQSVRELDQITELEGNLSIELGKIANQAAIKLNAVIRQHPELLRRAENPLDREEKTGDQAGSSMSGWTGLLERLHVTKNWARRNGKVELVRELNSVIKYGVFGLNELVLDHVNSLDTLITETLAQYDIQHDIELALTPMPARASGRPA